MGREQAVEGLAELRAQEKMRNRVMVGALEGDLPSYLEGIEGAVSEKPVTHAEADDRSQQLGHGASPRKIAPDLGAQAPPDGLEIGGGGEAQVGQLEASLLKRADQSFILPDLFPERVPAVLPHALLERQLQKIIVDEPLH